MGHVARHAADQRLAESGISKGVAKSILEHQFAAYAHYYRTVSANYANKQMRKRYELDEKKDLKEVASCVRRRCIAFHYPQL